MQTSHLILLSSVAQWLARRTSDLMAAGSLPTTTYDPQVQPAPATQPMTIDRDGDPVQDNFILSVASIFCCFILGIIATLKAQNSRDKLSSGDISGARRDSADARKLAISSIVCGCIIVVFVIFLPLILWLAGVIFIASR
ncbi:interferon-induced transmembrane protein [Elysia marginata]|uniref:Interferon-induced transmembrane protein n=1 Tax=Elysia marginata TaxID=1093978 RepID=A0AAV4JJG7_9GAST|nr:interferon-induced transmembrane protein [Elysia marginata]